MLPLSVCSDLKPRSAVGVAGMEGHLKMAQNIMPGKKRIVPFYMHINETIKYYDPSAEIDGMILQYEIYEMHLSRGQYVDMDNKYGT